MKTKQEIQDQLLRMITVQRNIVEKRLDEYNNTTSKIKQLSGWDRFPLLMLQAKQMHYFLIAMYHFKAIMKLLDYFMYNEKVDFIDVRPTSV